MTRIGSKKSLVYKLGIKDGFKIYLHNPPAGYSTILGRLPKNVVDLDRPINDMDFIQMFTTSKKDLVEHFPKMMGFMQPEGILWVCWPKESSNVKSDLNGHFVRDTGVSNGLSDVKVSSIDDTWSGLKFVRKNKEK
ncbi:MAG TPA: hypothetical protein VLH13_00230 [Methanomassiliicoccales archaeon]|nr:hypothetical protein [Methanomassiliicoccales archaeon]